MTLAIGLLVAAYVLAYAGFKGENPLDVIASTFTGKAPQRLGAGGGQSYNVPTDASQLPPGALGGNSILSIAAGVAIPPHHKKDWIYARAYIAASAAGGGYEITSWWRPGATVKGTDRESEHSCGNALDIKPKAGTRGVDWHKADLLVTELWRTLPDEVIFRGDPDHDPALTSNGHVHVGYGKCA